MSNSSESIYAQMSKAAYSLRRTSGCVNYAEQQRRGEHRFGSIEWLLEFCEASDEFFLIFAMWSEGGQTAWQNCRPAPSIASAATNTCCGGKRDRLCLRWSRCDAASDSRTAHPFLSRSGDASPAPCPKSSGDHSLDQRRARGPHSPLCRPQ